MVKALRSVVVGPLERFAGGFVAELARQGYSEESAVHQLVLIAHLSRWMVEQDVDVTDLSPSTVGRYVSARLERGYRGHRSTRALTPLLAYLRGLGVLNWDRPTADSADAVLLRQFREYLVSERGLSAGTAEGYVREVAGFVDWCVRDGGDLQDLQVGAVTGFMVAQSRRVSPKSVQRSATALRALLRYWHVQGITVVSLVGAVPTVANRSRELVRGLPPEQVEALLNACDRGCPSGLRDYAMLTMLTRVGLRSCEVARLELDDIRWRNGEIVVRGKGNRVDLLPLPVDVGMAIVEYVQRGRPPDALDRRLFIRIQAPHQGLTSGGVTQRVGDIARRAGLGVVHAHRLRYTVATSMLAAGASLTEIGQVLRHRSQQSTAIYAKVDIAALRGLARPWPTGGLS